MTLERFPALDALPGIRAGFIQRIPGIPVDGERDAILQCLAATHRRMADAAGFAGMPFATAQQVHGGEVAIVHPGTPFPVPDVDALATASRGLCLAIYVADCAAVFLADRGGRAIALAHSGKKGTECGIAARAVRRLAEDFQIPPGDLTAVISPCIRPPHYEVDFASEIRDQLRAAGVGAVVDDTICTASHPERYYSYRRERGRTGRMLALLALV